MRLLTDEELNDLYFNPPTTMANENVAWHVINASIAEAEHKKTIKYVIDKIGEYATKQKEEVRGMCGYASDGGFCECSCVTQDMQDLEVFIKSLKEELLNE